MAQNPEPQPEGRDLSVSLARANVLTVAIAVPLVGLMLVVYRLLAPGGGGLAVGGTLASALAFLTLLVVGILAHEGIHGLAWAWFGRFPLKRIRFGFQASTLTPYAHALDPMPARVYRLGAALPALVLGVLPFAVGTAVGSAGLALYGMIFTFAAGGDLLVLWLIRSVDARARVLDHPSRAGCIVLAPAG
jgi:hypothetical protein